MESKHRFTLSSWQIFENFIVAYEKKIIRKKENAC